MQITRGRVPCAKRVLIYGTSGIGKSTLGACFPEAIFIDVEGSTKELTVGRLPDPERWEDIINELRWVTANTDELKTVVIDTIDWAERLAIAYVCKQHGLKSIEGANYGKGYVWLAEEISRFLRFCSDVVDAGINVVLIAHSQLRRVELPDEMGAFDMYDLKTEKRTAPLYKEWADMVLFCNYKTDVVTDGSTNKRKAKGGKRVMYTTHRPQWDAKNRFDLPDELPMEYAAIEKIFENVPKKTAKKSAKPPKENPAKEWAETPKQAIDALDESEDEPAKVEYNVPPTVAVLLQTDNIPEDALRRALVKRGYLGHTDDDFDDGLVDWITQPETWKVVSKAVKEDIETDDLPF